MRRPVVMLALAILLVPVSAWALKLPSIGKMLKEENKRGAVVSYEEFVKMAKSSAPKEFKFSGSAELEEDDETYKGGGYETQFMKGNETLKYVLVMRSTDPGGAGVGGETFSWQGENATYWVNRFGPKVTRVAVPLKNANATLIISRNGKHERAEMENLLKAFPLDKLAKSEK